MVKMKEINDKFPLGRLTLGLRSIQIQDLVTYSQKKLCGRILLSFKWLLLGKGFPLLGKTSIEQLILKHPNGLEILENYPILRTFIKVNRAALNIFENQNPEGNNNKDYPGIKTIFKLKEGDWSYLNKDPEFMNTHIRRKIIFEASNYGSITTFELYGYKNGSLGMWVDVKESHPKVINYFLDQEPIENYFVKGDRQFFFKEDVKKLKKIFEIVKANNQFPEEHLNKITEIINSGKHPIEEEIEKLG